MLRRILYFSELSETTRTEKGSRSELYSCSLFYWMGVLEPLLLSILRTMDEFCWRDTRSVGEFIMVDFVDSLFAKGTK